MEKLCPTSICTLDEFSLNLTNSGPTCYCLQTTTHLIAFCFLPCLDSLLFHSKASAGPSTLSLHLLILLGERGSCRNFWSKLWAMGHIISDYSCRHLPIFPTSSWTQCCAEWDAPRSPCRFSSIHLRKQDMKPMSSDSSMFLRIFLLPSL